MGAPDYSAYHDREWGRPVTDDRLLFERVCLEGFQAGLSWLTVLRKREEFRRVFAGFDFNRVARFTPATVARLLRNPGIIRHRGKIAAAINNARRAQELVAEAGSLAAYFARYRPRPASRPRRITRAVLRRMAVPPEALALSQDLRRRGWRFVGPTTMYALMQATGLVNDHIHGCWARTAVARGGRRNGIKEEKAGRANA